MSLADKISFTCFKGAERLTLKKHTKNIRTNRLEMIGQADI